MAISRRSVARHCRKARPICGVDLRIPHLVAQDPKRFCFIFPHPTVRRVHPCFSGSSAHSDDYAAALRCIVHPAARLFVRASLVRTGTPSKLRETACQNSNHDSTNSSDCILMCAVYHSREGLLRLGTCLMDAEQHNGICTRMANK